MSSWRRFALGERFGGGASEVAGLAIEGESNKVDLFASVAVGFGVALFLNLVEGLLGRTVDLELENEDTFKSLGNQVCSAFGLTVLSSHAEEAAGSQQNIEDALEGEFLHIVLFRTIREVGVEVREFAEESFEIGLLQGPASGITVAISFFLVNFWTS